MGRCVAARAPILGIRCRSVPTEPQDMEADETESDENENGDTTRVGERWMDHRAQVPFPAMEHPRRCIRHVGLGLQ